MLCIGSVGSSWIALRDSRILRIDGSQSDSSAARLINYAPAVLLESWWLVGLRRRGRETTGDWRGRRPITGIAPLFAWRSTFLAVVHYSSVICATPGTPSHLLRLCFHMPGPAVRGYIWYADRGEVAGGAGRGREGINSISLPSSLFQKVMHGLTLSSGETDEMLFKKKKIKMEMNLVLWRETPALWDSAVPSREERSVLACWWVGGGDDGEFKKKKKGTMRRWPRDSAKKGNSHWIIWHSRCEKAEKKILERKKKKKVWKWFLRLFIVLWTLPSQLNQLGTKIRL